jgi:hypothetical protein
MIQDRMDDISRRTIYIAAKGIWSKPEWQNDRMRNGLKDSASLCMYGDMENLKCMQHMDKSNEQESSQRLLIFAF